MANANAPFGLRPIKYDERLLIHGCLLSSDATAHYLNQPVVLSSAGTNTTAINGMPAGTLPIFVTAGTSGAFTGTIHGFMPGGSASENILYNPASTEREIIVCVDPDAIYEIQASGALAATDVNNNINLAAVTAGNTFTGVSSATADIATLATTSTLQLKVKEVKNVVTNALGTYAVLEVKINNTTNAALTAGI